jgi:hypothetical protein
MKRAAWFLPVAAILVLSGSATNAGLGYCSKPYPPNDYITKPIKPYCATTRSCSQWEVDNYKRGVENYFDKLKRYLGDVDEYRDQAYDYAKCMADLD